MDIHPGLANGPVYLDYNGTTPVDPRVASAAQPYLATQFGNPSSTHRYAAAPAQAVRTAREQIAALIGATTTDGIVFTGSGSIPGLLVDIGQPLQHRLQYVRGRGGTRRADTSRRA